MIISVPREIKNNENRVAITPAGVSTLVQAGHQVKIETRAGIGSGFADEDYAAAGAKIVQTAEDAWEADMVMKVKEPLPEEYRYFRQHLILFTYLHLAPLPDLTKALLDNAVTGIAYETIQLDNGELPLLQPMSEVAGRMAVQVGAHYLEKASGGKGVLLGGVPGVLPGRVTIIGGGIVGINAAKIAAGMGAQVTLLDINPSRLRYLDEIFNGRIRLLMSHPYNIAQAVKDSDLVIGAVLIPGARSPRLVTEEMVKQMEPVRSSSMLRLIREDRLKRLTALPRMMSQLIPSMASSITPCRICLELLPAHPHWRWPTQRLPMRCKSPTTALKGRLPKIKRSPVE